MKRINGIIELKKEQQMQNKFRANGKKLYFGFIDLVSF